MYSGGQVRTMSHEQSMYFDPILSPHTIFEDSLECNAQMDWISLTVLPNESVKFVEFPNARTRLKK
jgi:hypothetical protein